MKCTKLRYINTNTTLFIVAEASKHATGSVVQQTTNGEIAPIYLFSIKLSPSQQRYNNFHSETSGLL